MNIIRVYIHNVHVYTFMRVTIHLSQAPEVIRMAEPDPYTPYCDVYSFGVVIYELITGQLPYSHVEGRDTVSYGHDVCMTLYM